MIAVKDRTVLNSLLDVSFDPILMRIIWWIDESWPDLLTITCGYRRGDIGSVHATIPCRGIDIRSWVYKDPWKVARRINKEWIYDPERPEKKVCKLHDSGSGYHMHIQSHANTRRRLDEEFLG